MQKRERLLAQVRTRLDRFNADHNPATILDAAAVDEVHALLEMVPDPAADLEVAYVAGWLHWSRYLVLSIGNDQEDLAAALTWFAPLYESRPEVIPDEIRAHFDENRPRPHDDLEALASEAVSLLQGAQNTGDDEALNTAIDLLRRVLGATPPGPSGRAMYPFYLSLALQARFRRSGRRADLDEAVAAGRDAVAAARLDDPGRAMLLSGLGLALQDLFGVTGDQAEMDEAITALRDAAAAVPSGQPDRYIYLSSLGLALRARVERAGVEADIDEAVTAFRDAAATAPVGHCDRAVVLSNLGLALQARIKRTGEQADIDEAVMAFRAAAAAAPVGHPDRAVRAV